MNTTDPIADMLTRIRNALSARKAEVLVPQSKVKLAIANILLREGYVAGVESVKTDEGFSMIKIAFAANERDRAIVGLRRISKPGLRVYSHASNLPKVLSGLGIAIISTSKGILTDKEAREQNLGGEVLAYIW